MTTVFGQQEVLSGGGAVPAQAAPEAVAGFDPQYPASEIGDLRLVCEALTTHAGQLRGTFHPRQIVFANHLVVRRLEAAVAKWADPNGSSVQSLKKTLQVLQTSRAAQEEIIIQSAGDTTLPPEAFAPLAPWDARIQEVNELLADLRDRPSATPPLLSPFLQGPVRRAVMLQARVGAEPATRAAARDLAARRLPLSAPHLAGKVRYARLVAHSLMQTLFSLTH